MNRHYEVITVGGGFAGVAAAVSAARQGMKVLLVDKSGYLGGAPCNNYVNPFMNYHVKVNGETRKISDGIFSEILQRLDAMGGLHKNQNTFSEEILKLVFDAITEENGVNVLLHSYLSGVEMEGRQIKSIRRHIY